MKLISWDKKKRTIKLDFGGRFNKSFGKQNNLMSYFLLHIFLTYISWLSHREDVCPLHLLIPLSISGLQTMSGIQGAFRDKSSSSGTQSNSLNFWTSDLWGQALYSKHGAPLPYTHGLADWWETKIYQRENFQLLGNRQYRKKALVPGAKANWHER